MNYFLDIGANIGQTFDDFLLKTTDFNGWEILCFEPSPRHLAGLLKKASEVSGRFHVTVIPCAVSEREGLLKLYEKDDPRGDSLFEHLWSDHYAANRNAEYSVLAYQITLSSILKNFKKEDRVVVKLDCEGAEYGILRDLLKHIEYYRKIERLMVEFHRTSEGGKDREEEVRLDKVFRALGKTWEIWPY